MVLQQYWFEFDFNGQYSPLSFGCGITAWTYDDALHILQTKVFIGTKIPTIKKHVENIDVSLLDAGHIKPNMLPPNVRGVWYPIGYSEHYN